MTKLCTHGQVGAQKTAKFKRANTEIKPKSDIDNNDNNYNN